MEFVHVSRTALLDIVADVLGARGVRRPARRPRPDREASAGRLGSTTPRGAGPGVGPGLGWRPWRLVAGVCLGLACATKWSGLYFLAAFGLMTVLWDMGARRTAGVRRPWLGALVRDALPAFASLVLVALGVYLASWTGWFLGGDHGYLRLLGHGQPRRRAVAAGRAAGSLWHYHHEAWNFHTHLRLLPPLPVQPVGLAGAGPARRRYYYQSPTMRRRPAARSTSARRRSPRSARRRSGGRLPGAARAALPVGRCGATGGPARSSPAWSPATCRGSSSRTARSTPSTRSRSCRSWCWPWCSSSGCGWAAATPTRPAGGGAVRRRGLPLLFTLALFAFFHPVYVADTIPYEHWRWRMWFPSWI